MYIKVEVNTNLVASASSHLLPPYLAYKNVLYFGMEVVIVQFAESSCEFPSDVHDLLPAPHLPNLFSCRTSHQRFVPTQNISTYLQEHPTQFVLDLMLVVNKLHQQPR